MSRSFKQTDVSAKNADGDMFGAVRQPTHAKTSVKLIDDELLAILKTCMDMGFTHEELRNMGRYGCINGPRDESGVESPST